MEYVTQTKRTILLMQPVARMIETPMTALFTETAPLSVTHSYADPQTGETTTLTFDEFIPEHVVDGRIRAMGRYLAPLLMERPGQTVVVPILAGGSQTMDSILQEAAVAEPSIQPHIAHVKLRSYNGTEREQLTIDQDVPSGTFQGKRVFVFDEVVDRGHTMDFLVQKRIMPEKPEGVVVVTLVRKPTAHEIPVQADVVGFDVPPEFLLGRGMDWKHMGRWQRWIGRLRDGTEATYTTPPFPVHILGHSVLLAEDQTYKIA